MSRIISAIKCLRKHFHRLIPRKGETLPLYCPEGFQPVNLPIVGMMYEDIIQSVLKCSIGEEIWLFREPGNEYDKNAIKVANKSGIKFGYIGKNFNKNLAEYMDRNNIPIQARLTELTSKIEGTAIGAKVGFYLPKALYKQICSSVQIDFHCEKGTSGLFYLMLDCDEATLKVIEERLAESGFIQLRSGISYRPADNGHQYQWYEVLEEGTDKERLEKLFQDSFGVRPQYLIERDMNEFIEYADAENRNLKEETRELEEKYHNLLRLYQEKEKKRQNFPRKEELTRIFNVLLPNIILMRDSLDILIFELQDYQHILNILHDISINPSTVKAKRFQTTDDWLETHFKTGTGNNGRLYYKIEKNNQCFALISFKKEQDKDQKYLRSR